MVQILIIAVAIAAAILGLAWFTDAKAELIIAQARADLSGRKPTPFGGNQ